MKKIKKICSQCDIKKNIDEFYKHCNSKGGYRAECKICKSKNDKKYREKNKNYNKEYYIKNKKNIQEQNRKYYIKNRKKILIKSKKYRDNNKEKISISKLKYHKLKLKNNIRYRILLNLRKRIISALHGNNKSLSTMFLIGCEIDYFMYHIQEQFTHGMTWDNYGKGFGKWNMDHILPCASFDLSKPIEQRKCFHYSNIQPLWFEENAEKWKNYVKK